MNSKNNENFAEMQISSPEQIKKMKQAHKIRETTARATDRLSPKPFAQEFAGLKNIAFILLYALSMVSIITAISFFYFKFVESTGIYIAVILAVGILAGLEIAKNALFELSFQRSYTYGLGQVELILFFASFVMLGGSIYTSLQGAKEAYISIDKTQASQDTQHSHKTDSLRQSYQKRIEQERQDLNDFRKSVTWQGQINIYDQNVVKNINAHLDRIDRLEKERAQLLKTADKTHNTQREETAKNAGFNINFWVIFAGITEALIVVCNWFLIWYDHQTKQEPQIITGTIPLQNLLRNVQNFAPILAQHPQDISQYLPTNTYQVLNQDLTSKQQDLTQDLTNKKPIGFDRTYKDLPPTLEEAIQQGVTDTRVLSKAYKVNFNTINETRQRLKAPAGKPAQSLIITDLFTEKGGAPC